MGTTDQGSEFGQQHCPHGDETCPCPDGDICHYVSTETTAAMRCPTTGRTDGGCCRPTYLCWCDGTACDGRTTEPFTVCDECKSFGHHPLPSDGLKPSDVIAGEPETATAPAEAGAARPSGDPSVLPDWKCPRCGSTRSVPVSLNGGYTRIAQCVPCGFCDTATVLGPGWRAGRVDVYD